MEMFIEIECPLCNQKDYNIIKKQKIDILDKNINFENIFKSATKFKLIEQVVKCNNCSLVYLNPRVKEEYILRGYKDSIDVDHSSQDDYRVRTFDKFLNIFENKYKNILNSYKNFKVLDIGTASGSFLKSLKKKKWKGIGIEPNKKLSCDGSKKNNVEILNENLRKNLFPNNCFSVVFFWDVFEHLSNPNEALEISYDILNENGLIMINFPNYNTIIAKVLGNYWPFWLSAHLCYYNKKTISKILYNNNFKVLSFDNHWQTLSLEYVLDRASAYFKFFKIINFLVKKLKLGNIPIKYYLGQVQVIAQKK
tara:strand:+ start:4934 stop:5860 length:927 start_codon:yes stop_codon:yes gene_type:complete